MYIYIYIYIYIYLKYTLNNFIFNGSHYLQKAKSGMRYLWENFKELKNIKIRYIRSFVNFYCQFIDDLFIYSYFGRETRENF